MRNLPSKGDASFFAVSTEETIAQVNGFAPFSNAYFPVQDPGSTGVTTFASRQADSLLLSGNAVLLQLNRKYYRYHKSNSRRLNSGFL